VYGTNGTLTKTQDYIGEIVLKNGALDYLIHEEGRIVAEVDGLWGEYYVKDHLGNIRQVLRSPVSQSFTATMETQNAESEEQEFTQIEASRQLAPEHNKTVGGNQVAWLNADRGRMVGPGRSQEIYAGDSLILQVYGKYQDDRNQNVNAGSFATQGAKDKLINDLNELAVSTQRAGGANPIALFNLANILAGDLQKKEAPEAYLIYTLYDQDSNRYEVGKKVLTKNAANQHEVLEENMYISKDGYMETFVVNETSEDVWFDNMMVMSISSVIVQETHYDPWGLELTGLGFQYGGIKANKYLYNGKELIEDNGLQYYDYGARMYDPAIGRWSVIDPLSDQMRRHSPYNYAFDNPIRFIDPDGMAPKNCCGPPSSESIFFAEMEKSFGSIKNNIEGFFNSFKFEMGVETKNTQAAGLILESSLTSGVMDSGTEASNVIGFFNMDGLSEIAKSAPNSGSAVMEKIAEGLSASSGLLEVKTSPGEKINNQEGKNSTKSDTSIVGVTYVQGSLGISVNSEYSVNGGDTIKAKNVWHGSDLGAQIRKYEMAKENKDGKKDN
jgi:RHS repeat-associated protein